MTDLYTLERGDAPLLISIPHLGTQIPDALRDRYTDIAQTVADTDWHLDRLYAFAKELGATILGARISRYESVRKQRWGRPESLQAARRYNALAREIGMTPTQFALAFCHSKWQVASTIIGVTSLAQLDENLDTWDKRLPPEAMVEVDKLRREMRDPAI